MKISATHLKRCQEIASLLWKYGRSDLVQQMGIEEAVEPHPTKASGPGVATPDQLADDLEAMGPTYVKLGQVLSGRPDLLPDAYLKALARLQDQVKPFPYADVDGIRSKNLQGVLAVRSGADRSRLPWPGSFRGPAGWAIGCCQSPTTRHSPTNRGRL